MKIWVYQPRNAPDPRRYRHFLDAYQAMEYDNGMTFEEILEDDPDADWGGSEEEGYFYIDDGGSIELVEFK